VVEGYAVNQRFIIAQDPISQNIDIFWRCIFDNDIKCIVMIGDVSFNPMRFDDLIGRVC